MATNTPIQPQTRSKSAKSGTKPSSRHQLSRAVFDIFRRWGYLQATLDPLGQFLPPEPFPTPAPDGADSEAARAIYCGSIGAEFMHIPSPERRAWIERRLENDPPKSPANISRARILTGLIRADLFEQVIQQRYLGTKRFSLEGLTALIPFLDRGEWREPLGLRHEPSRPPQRHGQHHRPQIA
jgi:2-oxoglutarate dehydrogenase E1 component